MLPNLPTDNLYKFLALSGLAYFIFTIYHFSQPVENFHNKYLELQFSLNRAELEDSLLNYKYNMQSQYLDKFVSKLPPSKKDEDSILSKLENNQYFLQLELDDTKAALSKSKNPSDTLKMLISQQLFLLDNIQNRKLIESKLIDIKAQKANLVIISKDLDDSKYRFWLNLIIGLIVSTVGFTLWFFNIQIYEDAKLRQSLCPHKNQK